MSFRAKRGIFERFFVTSFLRMTKGEDKDMTQQQIADILHINRRTYSAYENGVNSMTPETLCRIADIYNTSVDYLLNRTDIKEPYKKSSHEK